MWSIWSKQVIFGENGQKIAKNLTQGLTNDVIYEKIDEVRTNFFIKNVLYNLGNKKTSMVLGLKMKLKWSKGQKTSKM